MRWAPLISSISFSHLLILTGAFKISLYTGKSCTGASDGTVILGPKDGCRKDAAGVAAAAVIRGTDPQDDNSYTVFFSSDDCDPDTAIAKGDDGCVAANYGSFAVWNVCPDGRTNCLA